jgi:hypothetical protein
MHGVTGQMLQIKGLTSMHAYRPKAKCRGIGKGGRQFHDLAAAASI